jgi:hypothetical protein
MFSFLYASRYELFIKSNITDASQETSYSLRLGLDFKLVTLWLNLSIFDPQDLELVSQDGRCGG